MEEGAVVNWCKEGNPKADAYSIFLGLDPAHGQNWLENVKKIVWVLGWLANHGTMPEF